MRKLFILLSVFLFNHLGFGQTILTNHTNTNGQECITFNVVNNNAYSIKITDVHGAFFTGGGTANVETWYKTTPVNGAPGAITAANGWTFAGTSNVTKVTSVGPLFAGALNITIPPGASYGLCFGSPGQTIAYQTIAGPFTFSNSGVDVITGGTVGWGGSMSAGPLNNPRGICGGITFVQINNPNDAGISSIVEPNATSGCPSASTNVIVRLKNYGNNNISNVPIKVNQVGATTNTLTTTYTGTLAPGNSVDVTVGTVNMSAPGFHFLFAKTEYPGDNFKSNDSIFPPYQVFNTAKNAIPYSESFNTSAPFAPTGYTGNMNFTTTGSPAQQHGNGATPGMYFNLFSFGTLFTETLPKIGTFNNDAQISFDYRIVNTSGYANPGGTATLIGNNDSLLLQVSDNCGNSFKTINFINGANHSASNLFKTVKIPLSSYGGKDLIFRFVGKWNSGDYFIDIDNINVSNDTNDFTISSIISPMPGTCYKNGEVKVVIKNGGTVGKGSIPVVANLTGAINQTFNYTYPYFLGPGQSDTIVIGNYVQGLGGAVDLKVFTNYSKEEMRGNDTNSVVFFNTTPVSVSASPEKFCDGGASNLTASSSSGYLWSTTETSSFIVVSPNTTTDYWVEGTDANTCKDTAYKTIVVFSTPVVVMKNDTICRGTYGAVSASGGVSYVWSSGFGNKKAITDNPTVNTQYFVTVTNANNCTATGTATIDVKDIPTAIIVNDSQCVNNNATVGASGGVSYNWGVYGTNNTVTSKLLKTTIFPVVITGANGCKKDTFAMAYKRNAPNVVVIDTTICEGNGVTIYASGGVSYQWAGGLGTNPTVNIAPSSLVNSSTFQVTITDAFGCVTNDAAKVTVNKKPKLVLNDEVICLGGTATLSANNNIPGSVYKWSAGNGQNINITPTSTASYTVTVTDPSVGGCVVVGSTTVFVKEKPTVKILPIDNIVCNTLNAMGLNATPQGGVFSGSQVQFNSFYPKKAGIGTYTIKYTYIDAASKGCNGEDSISVNVQFCPSADVKSMDENINVMVYPNPVVDVLKIDIRDLSSKERFKITIKDITGKLVWNKEVELNGSLNTVRANLENLSSGQYVVELNSENYKFKSTIIKE